MTEQEWLSCTDPYAMLGFLHGRTSDRKLRLFACACCRQIWQVITDGRSRKAVEVAEQAIDELVGKDQLQVATLAAHEARNAIRHRRGSDPTETHVCRVAANACWEAASAVWSIRGFRSSVERAAQESADVAVWIGLSANLMDARAKQSQCLRCIFGNPLRPVTINPACLAWNDRTVSRLAQAIYDDRAFDRLPILADALEEAGCGNVDILTHCRQPGEHVRGCWVVDLLLNKS